MEVRINKRSETYYVAFYEDRAKTDALMKGEDQEAYSEIAQTSAARTRQRFASLDEAVKWSSKAVNDELTVYGCAEVREITPMERPCQCCICGGTQIVRRHIVDESGIQETHEEESVC